MKNMAAFVSLALAAFAAWAGPVESLDIDSVRGGTAVVTNVRPNVVHFSSATTNYSETAAQLVDACTNGWACSCAFDGDRWLTLKNVTRTSYSGYPAFWLTFACENASAAASGFSAPFILSTLAIPAANLKESQHGYYRLLPDGFTALTNSANFRLAVNTISGGGVTPQEVRVIATNAVDEADAYLRKPSAGGLSPNGRIAVYDNSRNVYPGDSVSSFARVSTSIKKTYDTNIEHYSVDDVIMYNASDTADFKKNCFYRVVRDYISPGVWSDPYWKRIDVQPHQSLDGYVPTTRKVNGQPLSSDVEIVGMTANALVLSNGVVQTAGGTNALPKEINAISASEFAVPWKQYSGYQRLDTVSYGGKIWVCAEEHDGEEVFNEQGHWMDLVSTRTRDRSWVYWNRYWIDANYAALDDDVTFGSVSASSATVGYQGTGTVSANLSGGATINSGRTLAVANGATFTINGSNFNTVVGSAIDAKVASATNAAVGQVHRIMATNGLSAVDGDLSIFDSKGCDYDSTIMAGVHFAICWNEDGSPYWTANYSGATWNYNYRIWHVSGTTWHAVCPELGLDDDYYNVGALWADTLDFRAPVGQLTKSAVRSAARHGSVVPSYLKVAGRPLTNDVPIDAATVGAIPTNQLNSGMTWKSGSLSQMNGTLMVGNTGTLQANNTSKVWFINPDNVKVGSALTYSAADDLKAWIGHNAAIPFSQRYDSALSLRRYQVSPSGYGIGAYQFVGGKFYAKQWSDYMIYDDSGDIIQTWSLPWYLGQNYVPNTRKVNGQPLSSDVTIQTMDYPAMTNTVNAVKNLHYDPGLQVTWTNVISNGHIYYVTVTNTNISTL